MARHFDIIALAFGFASFLFALGSAVATPVLGVVLLAAAVVAGLSAVGTVALAGRFSTN